MATASQQRRDQDSQLEGAVEVLSDEYSCRILAALDDGPKPARVIANRCGMSRPTVYRRLNQLEAVGFVQSRKQREPDGNHRKYFELVLNEIRFEVSESGIDGQISLAMESAD